MAFIGFALPKETARILSEIEVPGEREAPGTMHVTMMVFGDEVPIADIAQVMEVAYGVASKVRPFTIKTSTVSCFPGNPSGTPIICLVESDTLHELWEAMRDAFDAAGVEYSRKFPEYKPHVTLAYADAPIPDRQIPTVEWGAHELVVWGGDSGDRRVIVHLPFSLQDRVANRYRIETGRSGLSVGRNSIANRVLERFKARD